jgi:hypothetical protein
MKRRPHSDLVFLVLFAACIAPRPAPAEEERDPPRHHFSVLAGGTRNFDENETHGTYGADYVYRLGWNHGRFGLSGFGEIVFAEHTEWILGFPLYVYLTPELFLCAGPGVEFVKKEKEEPTGTKTERDAEFLVRVGTGYVFELGGGFSLTPTVDYDGVRHNRSLVFGTAIGRSF